MSLSILIQRLDTFVDRTFAGSIPTGKSNIQGYPTSQPSKKPEKSMLILIVEMVNRNLNLFNSSQSILLILKDDLFTNSWNIKQGWIRNPPSL
jgi:hypothetical protein